MNHRKSVDDDIDDVAPDENAHYLTAAISSRGDISREYLIHHDM